MSKKQKANKYDEIPALTIAGKRMIIEMAKSSVGNKYFLNWLKQNNIPSLQYMKENVRKYKSRFFREMYELTKINPGDKPNEINFVP